MLLTIGSRLISATRASLLVNLELPFAPLWVWLAFGEVPSQATAIGGGIVCVAVVLDLVADRALPWLSVGGRWWRSANVTQPAAPRMVAMQVAGTQRRATSRDAEHGA